jgi:hypothetical protein
MIPARSRNKADVAEFAVFYREDSDRQFSQVFVRNDKWKMKIRVFTLNPGLNKF